MGGGTGGSGDTSNLPQKILTNTNNNKKKNDLNNGKKNHK